MKIAVEGCCHGELDKIYESIQFLETKNNMKVDLLLICGDFQAIRNRSDLCCMAVPQKYQKLNTFYKYYSGEKVAPILTVMIGGNHEASNYLQELPYGGWIARNIYYLGWAGVVKVRGVRIGGISGIFKSHDYHKGHYEQVPFGKDTVRSVYHIRSQEVFRLKQLRRQLDVVISHDWPQGIWDHGDVESLLRKKPFFRSDVQSGRLGAAPLAELISALKPTYWFAAHLHCKFPAVMKHQDGKNTKFLALDKCLPRRQFLQVIDVEAEEGPTELELDPEWLSVLQGTDPLLSCTPRSQYFPGPGSRERFDYSASDEDLASIREGFGGLLKIPDNFERTAAKHDPTFGGRPPPPKLYVNPQTTLLCEVLGLTNPATGIPSSSSFPSVTDDVVDDRPSFVDSRLDGSGADSSKNPDEIDVDLSDQESEGEEEEGSMGDSMFHTADTSKLEEKLEFKTPEVVSGSKLIPAASTPIHATKSRIAANFESPIGSMNLPPPKQESVAGDGVGSSRGGLMNLPAPKNDSGSEGGDFGGASESGVGGSETSEVKSPDSALEGVESHPLPQDTSTPIPAKKSRVAARFDSPIVPLMNLNLPAPKNDSESGDSKVEASLSSAGSDLGSSVCTEGGGSEEPKKKTFKRRNQSLYSGDD